MALEPLDPAGLPQPVDVSDNTDELARVDAVVSSGPFEATWESLRAYRPPRWYGDAKFGIFLHWGAYAVPAFQNEWYPRNMYRPGTAAFEHNQATYGPQSRFGYKDFLPHFRMENFRPEDWVALFKRSGAQYVMPVAEHHDGYALYATKRSRWNAAQIGPRRDLLGDLLAAVDDAWLIRGASSHRAEHWFFMNGGLTFDSDVADPRFADLYGPALRKEMNPTERFLEDWLLRSTEIIDTYRPQILFFDTGIEEPSFEPYLRRLAAYYYNRAAEWGREVVLTYKWDAFPAGAAVPDVERGSAPAIAPTPWQSDTSVSRTSWSWVDGHDYKAPAEIIAELADVVSKNGNLLLNIGPKPDGTIPESEARILEAVGSWLAVNGEAIYGTTPWTVYGEGPSRAAAGAFSDAAPTAYGEADFRFTTMSEVGHRYVYAISLAPSPRDHLSIRAFAASGRLLESIREIRVLGHRGPIRWQQTDTALEVDVPAGARPADGGVVVRVELEPNVPPERIDFFHGLWI